MLALEIWEKERVFASWTLVLGFLLKVSGRAMRGEAEPSCMDWRRPGRWVLSLPTDSALRSIEPVSPWSSSKLTLSSSTLSSYYTLTPVISNHQPTTHSQLPPSGISLR